MEVLLMTAPSGAMLPRGKVTVLVRPRAFALSGGRMTSSGETPSIFSSSSRKRARRWLVSHCARTSPRGTEETDRTDRSRRPSARRWSMTSGTPPAMKTRTVG